MISGIWKIPTYLLSLLKNSLVELITQRAEALYPFVILAQSSPNTLLREAQKRRRNARGNPATTSFSYTFPIHWTKTFPFQIHSVASPEAAAFAQIACFGHSAVLQPWLLATMGRPGWHPYLDTSRC